MILALETATSACSAAVLAADGTVLGEELAGEGPAHSQRLLPGAHAALAAAGAGMVDVDTVVVSLGPGAFTGLRIGVATGRALARACGARLGGVPTLEALAQALAAGEHGASATTFVALVDGRRGEVFAGCFRRAGGAAASAGGPSPLEAQPGRELVVVSAADLGDFLSAQAGAVVGGDGAVLHADLVPPSVVHDRAVALPTAAMIGRTWLSGSPRLRAGFADVLPVYGRRPDATPRARASSGGVPAPPGAGP